jgi:DNA-binding CsgD family transcriptional regulator
MTCAAVPITDPRTCDVLGAVDLSCRTEHTSPLMLPLAKRAAREIHQRLLDEISPAERTLREHFVNARRRTRDGVLSVSRTTMLSNARVTRALQPGDHELLWDWVTQAVASHQSLPAEVQLNGGTWVIKRLDAIADRGMFVGATLQLSPPAPPSLIEAGGASSSAADRPRFGWASLTPTELSVAALVAEGLTNREVAARLYLSPHTVGFHLRQVLRKLEISSRVELTRLIIEHQVSGLPI